MSTSKIFKKIILSLLISLFASVIYNYLLTNQLSKKNYKLVVSSSFSQENNMQLYYNDGGGFNEMQKINKKVGAGENISSFSIKNEKLLQSFRIDYDQSVYGIDSVKINRIQLSNNGEEILSLNQNEVINNVLVHSKNLNISNNNFVFLNKNQEDTFIIFKSIFKIKTSNSKKVLLFALPFVMVFFNDLFNFLRNSFMRDEMNNFFSFLLILSIPLKDSLTSLVILIWAASSLLMIYKKKAWLLKTENLVLLLFFLIPIIFGRPNSYSNINILLTFVVFIFINSNLYKISKLKIYKFYILFMLILSVSFLSSWFANIFIFNDFIHFSVKEYFSNLKLVGFSFREWIPYSHPAYFSLFLIISNLFAQNLFKNKVITFVQYALISIVFLMVILILGSRIALLLYFMMILLIRVNPKRVIIYFVSCFILFTTLLLVFVDVIDPLRSQLWKVSCNEFLNNPIFGFGLGMSKSIIGDFNANINAGYNVILPYNHPHNQIVLYLLEIGILGILVLIISIAFIYFKKFKSFSQEYLVVFCIYCFLFMVESTFETSKPTVLFCFYLIITNSKHINLYNINKIQSN